MASVPSIFSSLLDFLGFSEPRRRIQVQLVAEGTAKELPGFGAGALTLTATTGETLGAVMSRYSIT